MNEEKKIINYCSLPVVVKREFGPDMNPHRLSLIREGENKWVNGTVLHYYFFDKETDGTYVSLSNGSREWQTWTTNEDEKNVVRNAFKKWKDLGIGLQFKEVPTREESDVRIGFMKDNLSWSLVGRDIINFNIGKDERTMNFGWDLTRDVSEIDTAIHEIGHTLGFQHEHQNPKSGIVWNEEAVYTELAGPPNFWTREMTYNNIIRKIDPNIAYGSNWDPNSIMHYPFSAGLIMIPHEYENGLTPAGGISEKDKMEVRAVYPPLDSNDLEEISLLKSNILALNPGEQKNFIIKPSETKKYNIATFGESDVVMVLFEKSGDDEIYVTGNDDSGEDHNANINLKLYSGKEYILRIRLYYSRKLGHTAVMYW